MAKKQKKKNAKTASSKYKTYINDSLTKKIYKNVIEEYSQVARIYDDKWKSYLASTEEGILEQLKLKGKETILDAGCGTGSLIAAIRKKSKNLAAMFEFFSDCSD